MNRPRVVVVMEGGVINDIISNVSMDVLVLDSDTEGADEDRIKEIILLDEEGNSTDIREEYYVSTWDVPAVPITVEHYFKQIEFYGEEADDGEEGSRGPNSEKP